MFHPKRCRGERASKATEGEATFDERRTLAQGAAGEVRHGLRFDLPRRAEANVALHLIDRRGDPSSKEGTRRSPTIPANSFPPAQVRDAVMLAFL
jgi:hypothetical protein